MRIFIMNIDLLIILAEIEGIDFNMIDITN